MNMANICYGCLMKKHIQMYISKTNDLNAVSI